MTFETIAIGDELLTGKIADTNSAWIAARLFAYGQRLHRSTVVADAEDEIVRAVHEAAARSQFIVCFGGLGPTSDDKTAAVLAKILKTDLITDEPSKERLLRYLEARGRTANAPTMKQVLYPRGTSALPNENGMAPGFSCALGEATFFFLPGVPGEMKRMFETSVKPRLEQALTAAGQSSTVLTHTWKLLRIPEADVQKRMDAFEGDLAGKGWLGYRTRFPENHLSLYVPDTGAAAHAVFEQYRTAIGRAVADRCYTESSKELEELIVDALKARGQKLVLAESCTGGMVAARLSRVPGASDVLWGGYVVYTVAAKAHMVGLELARPEEAVSAEASRELARRARVESGADLSLGVTGYLGPAGGTASDPVGTVFLAVNGGTTVEAVEERFIFPPREREDLQWGAATIALDLIYSQLQKKTASP